MRSALLRCGVIGLCIVVLAVFAGCAEDEERPSAYGKHEIGSFVLDLAPLDVPLIDQTPALVIEGRAEIWTPVATLPLERLGALQAAARIEPQGVMVYDGSLTNRTGSPATIAFYTGSEFDSTKGLGESNASVTAEPGQTNYFGVDGGFDEQPFVVTRGMNIPTADLYFGVINNDKEDAIVDLSEIRLTSTPMANFRVPFPIDDGVLDQDELQPTEATLKGTIRNLADEPVILRLEFEGEIKYEGEFLAYQSSFLYNVQVEPGEERVLYEDVAPTFHQALKFFDYYGRHEGAAFYRIVVYGPAGDQIVDLEDIVLSYKAEKQRHDPEDDAI